MNSLLRISTCACALVLVSCGGGTDMATLGAPRQAASVIQSAPRVSTYPGNLSQYTVYDNGNGYTVIDNLNGTFQTYTSADRVRFADTAIAFDLNGTAGQAYRLYQAAFKRIPDLPGLGVQMNGMDVSGLSLFQISQNFIDSAEFAATYGNLNSTQFVTLLYANVLNRAPDPDGLAFHVSFLDGTRQDGRTLTRAQVLVGFSESQENKDLVINAIRNGIEYTPAGTSIPSNPPAEFANTYSGNFRGADNGTLQLTVSATGAFSGVLHSNTLNADLTGTGTLDPGGKFRLTFNGARAMNIAGSIQLSAGLATGTWLYVGTTESGVFNASKPTAPPPPPPITYASRIGAIVMQRCVSCHSAHPTQPGFNPAPLGIMFDTEGQVRARADQIKSVAVDTQFMPYGNITGMTQAERNDLAAWLASGQP